MGGNNVYICGAENSVHITTLLMLICNKSEHKYRYMGSLDHIEAIYTTF